MSNKHEIFSIAEAIKKTIVELDSYGDILENTAIAAAEAEAEYDKKKGIAMAELKNGRELLIGDEVVKNPSQSTIVGYANAVVWKEKLDMEIAKNRYRNSHKMCDILQTIMNGYQSIYKRLD
jgi:hypothetical protein